MATPNGSLSPLEANLSFGAMTQLDGEMSVAAGYQDGLQLGTLQGFDIRKDGTIMGTFDNGSEQALGQMALAAFSNPSGLIKIGANLLSDGPNSGLAQVAPPGSGNRGNLTAGFLEASNVDLSSEFANMIIAQRGFQANSRTITVSDEVIQELVQLKR
jgi:flagellar hook protein FlgE